MRENKYLEAFGKPFPASDVSWRLQYVNEQRMQGIAVPYLDARAVADRLDEVVGQNRWKDSFTPWHESVSGKKTKSSQLCTISIYDDELGQWIDKTDGAEDSDIEAVKGGLSEGVKKAALEFVKFSCTDAMLRDFTVTTGAPKAYKYDMGSDTSKLSSFSKDVINYVSNSKIIYKFSSSNFYNANIANLQYDVVYSAKINGSLYKNVVDGIIEGGATGTSYFESFNDYFKKYNFWK